MLLVFPFCAKDREQAGRLMQWIEELGSYPTHSLLLVREQRAAPILVGEGDSQRFKKVQEIIVRDPDNKWPSSPSLMFRSAAKQIQYTTNEAFFWCEPDCVPMREGWLDDLAVEYDAALKSGKYFLGDMIDHRNAGPNFVAHISGVSVYPKTLIQYAGEIFYAYDDVPFDIAAGPAIHSQTKQSELIFHVWQGPGQPGLAPFKDWPDVEAKIFARRPKCALFHADKTGTLLRLLRERKNFSGDVERLAGAKPDSQRRHMEQAERPSLSPSGESATDGSSISITDSESSASPAGNLLKAESLSDAAVISGVLRAIREYPKVYGSVVGLIPVDMVNDFIGAQASSNSILDNQAMFTAKFSTNPLLSIAHAIAGLIKNESALHYAKIFKPDSAGLFGENRPAIIANNQSTETNSSRRTTDDVCAEPVLSGHKEGKLAEEKGGASSAEPTSQPESSAEIPSARIAPEPTLVFELPMRGWNDQVPWGNRDASMIEIRRLAWRLRQFQTAPMTTHTVRSLLAEAGVIVPVKKKRREKRARSK